MAALFDAPRAKMHHPFLLEIAHSELFLWGSPVCLETIDP